MYETLIRVSLENPDDYSSFDLLELLQIKVMLLAFFPIKVMRSYRVILSLPKVVLHYLKIVSLISFVNLGVQNHNLRQQKVDSEVLEARV